METGKKRGRRLLAAGLSFLAAGVLAEVVVRASFGAPLAERLPVLRVQANPHRGWEMLPGVEHYTYHHRVRVNALGLRGPELGPKGEDTVRVLVLGDSLTYGQGVGDDETLPAYLEERLAATEPAGREWEVVNGGLRAYGTNQELALLEELGPAIEPDVVVLLWYWNDLQERNIEATYRRNAGKGPFAFDTGVVLEGRALWEWRAKQFVRRSALVMLLHDLLGERQVEPFDPGFVDRGLAKLDGYLARFVALGAERGFEPVFAVVPDARAVLGEHESAALAARAEELASEHGLHVVDLASPMRELSDEFGRVPVIPYDGHYEPAGNRALADALATALLGSNGR